jgi:hypothetical protein
MEEGVVDECIIFLSGPGSALWSLVEGIAPRGGG